MILSWMLYSVGVALLLGTAALGAETAFRHRGLPIRGVWAAALLTSLFLPAGAVVRMAAFPQGSAPGFGIPVPPAMAGVEAEIATATTLTPALQIDPWLLAAWGVGSALLAGWLFLAVRRLRHCRETWIPGSVNGRRVWVSRDTGPAVFGVVRGRIVVPEWLLDRSEDDRALILAHEEEHILARDPPLLAVALLLLVALPWNLPLWWQWRGLRNAVEEDCDRRVLRRGWNPHAYSRLLVEVSQHGSRRHLPIASLTQSPSHLERRIKAMITPRPRRWRLYASLSLAIAGASVVAACAMDHPDRVASPTAAPGIAGTAYDVSAVDEAPQLVKPLAVAALMNATYPAALKDAAIGGEVVVGFVVQRDGSISASSIEIVSASHTELANAAGNVVKQLTFRPGTLSGQRVPVRVQMPMTWGSGETASSALQQGARAHNGAYAMAELDQQPRMLNVSEAVRAMDPLYPVALRGTAGEAEVQFIVSAEGAVEPASIKVVRASHFEFGTASAKAVEAFRFAPGMHQGRAVRVSLRMPVTWNPTE